MRPVLHIECNLQKQGFQRSKLTLKDKNFNRIKKFYKIKKIGVSTSTFSHTIMEKLSWGQQLDDLPKSVLCDAQ